MKRSILFFLSVVMILTMFAVPVSAETLATVTVSSVEKAIAIGQDVEINVSVANNPGFTNFDWLVKFDTDRLRLKAFKTLYMACIEGEESGIEVSYLNPLIVVSNISTGKVAAAGSSAFTTADSTLFKIVFTVKEGASSGKSTVSIVSDNIQNDGTPLAFNYVAGTINVDGDEGHTITKTKKIFTITPVNIENEKIVILAIYDGGRLVDAQSAVYEGNELTFTTTATYTDAKVMVWEDLVEFKPVCGAEIVKQ